AHGDATSTGARDEGSGAATPGDTSRDASEARAEFELGRAHYLRGAYDEALPHLRRAYVLSNKRPSTIRALAQCERMLGSWDDAITLYREYLATRPGEAEEAAVARMLEDLERSRAEAHTTTARDDGDDALSWGDAPDPVPQDRSSPALDLDTPSVPEPADDPSIVSSPWFWIVTSAVVVGSAVALGAALQPASEEPLGGSLGRVLRR
ncbi:tetratricopeptide repeat protein, partial [Myxococcota bacterium]|nr:tetratricopeptide repeat protein [Myxococcota bacterium]